MVSCACLVLGHDGQVADVCAAVLAPVDPGDRLVGGSLIDENGWVVDDVKGRTAVNREAEDASGSHVVNAHWHGRAQRARRQQLRLIGREIFESGPIDA